ncbi:MAG: hydantoin racemase [Thermoprotei archaeon]|nr:MAG: hydantoin racemase [Thermoprotei archaeon]
MIKLEGALLKLIEFLEMYNPITLSIILLVVSLIITPFIRGLIGAYISLAVCLFTSSILALISLKVLITGSVVTLTIPLLPWAKYYPIDLSSIKLVIDPLTAYFTLLLSIIVFASSLYGFGYVLRFRGKEHLGWYGFNYSLFFLAMFITLSVRDFILFIIFWELMTLSSQFLVSYEKEKPRAVKAGIKYFCISKFGAEYMLIIAITLTTVLAMTTSFSGVGAFLKNLQTNDPILYYLLTSFFMLGLLIKCAAVPFHNWLPEAHPEAPANVSSLLSGTMIKIPIYMMLRLLLDLSNPTPVWGLAIAVIGCVTLFIGTMYALIQVDSKVLLAYHSIGQIGYILLALGTSIYLYSLGNYVLAFIALTAALYHAINHAVFKSLLFLTAGSVVFRLGTRDLNILGGLGKYMPFTAVCALIAALSISGVPPFNGFASKWMIYFSTMTSSTILAFLGAIAMFISSVTTASFIKYFTTLFTREARIDISKVKEVPAPMAIAQGILAILCILLGLYPMLAIKAGKSLATYLGLSIPKVISYGPIVVTVLGRASISLLMIATLLVITIPIVMAITKPKIVPRPWVAGVGIKPHHSIPASSYYRDFERVFYEPYGLGRGLYKALCVDFINWLKKSLPKLSLGLENPYNSLPIYIAIALLTYLAITMGLRWW